MKRFTKLMAVILSAAMAMVMCLVPAAASEMEDEAFLAESGKTYKVSYEKNVDWVKIKVAKKGTVKMKVRLEAERNIIKIYDSDGKEVASENLWWDSTSKIASETYEYKLSAGTYYISFKKEWKYNGDGKVTITYPSGSSSSSSSASSSSDSVAKLILDEGDKLYVAAVVSGKEKDVKWTSSNSSVAKVSSKGRVTAVKEGTATITAKSGSTTILTIIVEVN